MKEITVNRLVIYTSIFLITFANLTFFSNILDVYPANLENFFFLFSLPIVFCAFLIILLSLLCYRFSIKLILILVLLLSSMAAYFMDSYNIIIDNDMIDNVLKTDLHESLDLLSLKQLLYFLLLGVLPSFFIYKLTLSKQTLLVALVNKFKVIFFALLVAIILILSCSKFYASFFREHKILRFYANPSFYFFSVTNYLSIKFLKQTTKRQQIALDAKQVGTFHESPKKRLVFMILGETVRADHLLINGYSQSTTPLLAQINKSQNLGLFSFSNVWSCGTSTAVSVPCIFSLLDKDKFNKSSAFNIDNVLDILQRAGVNVLWLDNNSDSKGVALRVPYQSYKDKTINPVCDPECRDMGMLANLPTVIEQAKGDILVVLHQMGNHGPAYYKRYPKEFDQFSPSCLTNQLEKCSMEEINNAYDNAILYTDYFLAKSINMLKEYNQDFNTAMLYVSDHGESLGENGLYLHGLPYLFAPDEQKHVPMILWLGENNHQSFVDAKLIQKRVDEKYSHDNIFHTLLGLYAVETTVYDPKMDILR